jgi:hypothetical protein
VIEKIIMNRITDSPETQPIHPAQIGGDKGLDTGVNLLRLLSDAKALK